jgi:hypothetical protein
MSAGERSPLDRQMAELADRQFIFEDATNGGQIKDQAQKAQWESLRKQLAEFDTLKPPAVPLALTVRDVGPLAPPIRIPGESQGEAIEPGFLSVIDERPAAVSAPNAATSTGRRTALARWLTRPENPLTYRVLVNRVWKHHFGRGLVSTTSDFGSLGDQPSHPELLDWLTAEFVARGYSLKQMHRLMMASATYRQGAVSETAEGGESGETPLLLADAANRFLSRFSVRRLDAEQIRDAMLAASGELDTATGGPSVAGTTPRRSIYLKVVRNSREPLLDAFDLPEGFSSTSERNVTTTSTQALLLVNGQWTLERAAALARRSQDIEDLPKRVERVYKIVYGRPAEEDELAAALEFLNPTTASGPNPSVLPGLSSGGPVDSATAWRDFCHVLLNSNEFLYVD